MTTVLVCGGREYSNWRRLSRILDEAIGRLGLSEIIHGAAPGADALAAQWAINRNIPCRAFRADWRGLGSAAGLRRNQQMLDEGLPDIVIAFPGGKGTADMIARAEATRVRVVRVDFRLLEKCCGSV